MKHDLISINNAILIRCRSSAAPPDPAAPTGSKSADADTPDVLEVFTGDDSGSSSDSSAVAPRSRNSNPPVGAKRGRQRTTVNNGNVLKRINEHPEDLRLDAGRLYCIVCSCVLAEQKTATNRHLVSRKHVSRKAQQARRAEAVAARVVTLQQHFQATKAKGMNLSDSEALYRLNTLRMLMISGIPISKLDGPLRRALEHNNYSLTDSSHMRELIPVVQAEEMQLLSKELAGQHIAVIFDGTTDYAEVLAVVARYCMFGHFNCVSPSSLQVCYLFCGDWHIVPLLT